MNNLKLFEERIRESQLVMLASKSLRLFGISYCDMKKIIYEEEEFNEELKKRFGDELLALAFTNGSEIHYLCNEKIDRYILNGLNIHELLHIISNHINRSYNKIPEICQLAADHVTNRTIKEISEHCPQVKLWEGHVFFEDIHKMYPKATFEEVYDLLVQSSDQNQNKSKNQNQNNDSKSNTSNSSNNNKSSSKNPGINIKNPKLNIDIDIKTEKFSNNNSNTKNIMTIKDNKNNTTSVIPVDTIVPPGEFKSVEENCNKIKQNSQKLWFSNQISKGDLPGNLTSVLDDLLKIEFPWKEVLKSSILYTVQIKNKRSWLSKNFYIRNVRVPGEIKRTKSQEILLGCIDTSGSIKTETITEFFSILFDSMTYFRGLYIITHDVLVNFEKFFDKKVDMNTFVNNIKVKGRGGTSHKDAFDKIQKISEDYKLSNIAFLTDYYSNVEHIYDKYEWIKNNPTIWIINKESLKKKSDIKLEGCDTTVIKLT